jgi:hypothetical protein
VKGKEFGGRWTILSVALVAFVGWISKELVVGRKGDKI